MSFADLARAVFALAITLGLVGLAAYAARRFGPEWMVRLQRPKTERRLAIVESLPLDPARRLVLVRLDSTERLLLLGEGRIIADVTAVTPPRPPEQAA
jgi:flagellar protein FliO/FliZ